MIGSVIKAIEVMQAFSSSSPILSLADLTNILPYPKTTIFTLLQTLESKGFIEKCNSGQYALGNAIIPLTQAVRVNVQLRDRAAPLLRVLSDYCRESVYLAIPEDSHCLYIYAIESSDRLLARSAVGEIGPMTSSSIGKAILSFLPEKEVDRVIASEGLTRYTEKTIVEPDILKEELREGRWNGFCKDDSEHEVGVYCIGSPIFNEQGEPIAACSISGRKPEILTTNLEKFSSVLRFTAQEISRRMGFIPSRDTMIWREANNPFSD